MTYMQRNGHERYRTVHKSNNGASRRRREGALERLQAQTDKPQKGMAVTRLPLSDVDKKRINTEITILQIKLQHS